MTLAFRHLATDYQGDTVIAGTGLRVYTVLSRYQVGDSPETIADDHGIPVAAAHEALAYAFDHPDEMGAIRRADRQAEEAWIQGLPDQLRIMAMEDLQKSELDLADTIRRVEEARRGASIP